MKHIHLTLLLLLGLAACNPAETATSSSNLSAVEAKVADEVETAVDDAVKTTNLSSDAGAGAELNDSYKNALSIPSQLAIGTVQLEDSDLAVDEEEVADLLPLWEALSTLSQSDTTAPVELEAVVKQIQRTMSAEQIQAIAAMALTSDSLEELQTSGALTMGGPGMNRDSSSDTFQMPSGGGPGSGGGMGGPPTGGGGDMGGPPDGGFGGDRNMSDTSQDGSAQMDEASMQEMMLTNMVVRLLQTKTGQGPQFGPGGGGDARMTAMAAISEATGLEMPDIQSQLQDGQSLADIITANGAELDAEKNALQDALAETTLPEDQDLGTFIDQLLNGTEWNIPANNS